MLRPKLFFYALDIFSFSNYPQLATGRPIKVYLMGGHDARPGDPWGVNSKPPTPNHQTIITAYGKKVLSDGVEHCIINFIQKIYIIL